MRVERKWGTYDELHKFTNRHNVKTLVKHLHISAGKNISYQKHSNRSEVWTVVSGCGTLIVNEDYVDIEEGMTITISVGCWHAVKAIEDLHIIEVQYGNETKEEDIERRFITWAEIEANIPKLP